MKRAQPRRPPQPTLRLDSRDPQELLGLIPYLLGFRPEESFVLLLFRGSELLLSARVDLPPAAGAGQLADYGHALAVAHEATGAVAVAFGADFAAATALLDRWRARWARAERARPSCVLHDVLYADGEHWWSRTTAFGRSRTAGVPYDPRASGAAAAAVMAGLPALSSRSELEASVAGPAEPDRPALAALAARAVRDLDQLDVQARQITMVEAVHAGLAAEPSDEACARLAVLAAAIDARDAAWSMITLDRADDHVALWRRVVRRTIDRYALGPLALTGAAAWVGGHGALLNCCVERGLRLDPSYSMITLLAELASSGIPPTLWHELGPRIREEVWSETG
ncbi:DUF4192 domain-containing protein [Microlunatus parietis]|uniref:DUF4192 domain-containing protein n=1 Tax=Microlunatus parietis TaxID=682979 RepID=A0A7Y9LBQ4_9ACTN|nr:DUF4192 domain-containing protein [Microlunatus parietis]NYE74069.1 hypothetical protein [Microlunatus parietis]